MEVEHDQVRHLLLDHDLSRRQRVRRDHVVTIELEDSLEQLEVQRVVVDDQDPGLTQLRHHGLPAVTTEPASRTGSSAGAELWDSGSRAKKVLPRPGKLRTPTVPRWASTIRLVTARPSPVPP